jgi:hypothetical protein
VIGDSPAFSVSQRRNPYVTVVAGEGDGPRPTNGGSMKLIITAAVILATGTLLLAGCGSQPSQSVGPTSGPYNEESNPYCGALGACTPLNTAPYRLVPGF